jgi:amino acid adenylation domain-containing protein
LTVAQFLDGLLEKGVRLRLDGDRLVSEAEPGRLTPELLQGIRDRKAEIVAFLEQGTEAAPHKAPSIQPVSRTGTLPLSFAQERLWFLDQILDDRSLYNIPMALELRGALNRAALRQAVETLVARHEILRTSFPDQDGVPHQHITDEVDTALDWLERDLGDNPDEEAVRALVEAEAARPFELGTGPLIRVGLFRRGRERHVLLITMHHAVSDGWSMGVFWQELTALYRAFLNGEPSPLPALPIQYADYAAWQREWLKGGELERQLSYWRSHLADLALLELPTDRPRTAMQSYRGKGFPLVLDSGLVEGLRALGRGEGATLFMALLAGFKVLLYRYSGQTDIAVGTPLSGRNRSEVEGLLGLFINSLVIRGDVSGNPTFRELLGRIREVSLEAHTYQDLPFERLVEELQPERDASRNPLFQVMLSLQNTPPAENTLEGLDLDYFDFERDLTHFDLSLSLWETNDPEQGDVVTGAWEFAVELFDEDTVRRMHGHFENLLRDAVENPDRRVSELRLLDETELEALMVRSGRVAREIPEGVCVHDLFEARAKEDPTRTAVEAVDGSLSYGELDAEANRLAHFLAAKGIGPGTPVGICLPRKKDLMVGLMGILKAGGAYVPLEPDFPHDRLAFMMEDTGAPVVVTTAELSRFLPPYEGRIVLLDQEWDDISTLPATSPEVSNDPRNAVVIIYTSGSTGRPKGVPLEHGGVVNYLLSIGERPGLYPDDVVLATGTLAFDVSIDELFGTLSVGGKIVLAPQEAVSDGEGLRGLIEQFGVNLLNTTPATLRLLSYTGWEGDPSLRVLTGGEALPPDLAKQLAGSCKELWNVYGPAETTCAVTVWQVPEEFEHVSLGTPLWNTQVYVLDNALHPVPVGVPGEVCVGGRGVAKGYLNRPELTADRFVADPFSDDPQARLYRTGDVARFLDDGTLEYLGRKDDQVKVRGFRIELGEIEAVLAGHEAVRRAVAHVSDPGTPDALLVAYLVLEPDEVLTTSEVRRYLRKRVPDYMVPGLVVTLDELPQTASGKVDRKALPDPLASRTSSGPEYKPPTTPSETVIAEVWAELLELERIGKDDNFFQLGGHSLLMMRAVAAITKRSGGRIEPRAMFFQTLEQLASQIDETSGREA